VLWTEPVDLLYPWDAFYMPTDQYMWDARFRLTLTPEAAEGLMAGYTDIETWYLHMLRNWSAHYQSYGKSSASSIYKAMRRLADARPDPETGANRAISSALAAKFAEVRVLPFTEEREDRHCGCATGPSVSRHAGAATGRGRTGRDPRQRADDDNRSIAGQSLTGNEAHMEKIVDNLLGQFEHGRISRRQLVQMLALGMAAAATGSHATAAAAPRGGFKAVAVNHISFGVADYARTRDFYATCSAWRSAETTASSAT
jgi:hypothetical protein